MSPYATTLAVVFGAIAISIALFRARPPARPWLLTAWGTLSIAYFPWLTIIEVERGYYSVREGLPLHLCDISAIVLGYVAIRAARAPSMPAELEMPAEICFYLGTGGGLAGLFVPQVAPDHATFVPFMAWHAALVGVPAVLVAHGMQPTLRGLGRAVIVLVFAIAPIVAAANLMIDANYMFLRRPPAGTDAFMPSAPWHVFALFAIGTLVMFATWAPFAIRRRLFP